MIRDLIREAGGLVRFVLGGALCAVWLAACLALPAFAALAFGVAR